MALDTLSDALKNRLNRGWTVFKESALGTRVQAIIVAVNLNTALLANVAGIKSGTSTVVAANGELAVTGVGFQPTQVLLTMDTTAPGPATAEPTLKTLGADGFTIAILGNDDKAAEACNVTNCKVYWIAIK